MATRPTCPANEEALKLIIEAIAAAGYRPASRWRSALDVAASEFFDAKSTRYRLKGEGKDVRRRGAGGLLPSSCAAGTPSSPSRTGWRRTTGRAGRRSPARWAARCSWWGTTSSSPTSSGWPGASTAGVANSILVKVNQIGTLTETFDAVRMAHRAGYTLGDVATARARPRTSPSPTWRWRWTAGRSRPARCPGRDRVAKYNQLLRIEEALGGSGALRRAGAPFGRGKG